jgi:hypothetical protein
MSEKPEKTIGQAIDEIVNALSSVDPKLRITVVRAACEALEIDLAIGVLEPSPSQFQPGEVFPAENLARARPNSDVTDIRTLKEQKQPSNTQEMACLVAYYLQELAPPDERKTEIGTGDLDQYFNEADFNLPKKMPQVLVDAKGSGYFRSTGRGKYKLTPVGYNLAARGLPRKSAGKQ